MLLLLLDTGASRVGGNATGWDIIPRRAHTSSEALKLYSTAIHSPTCWPPSPRVLSPRLERSLHTQTTPSYTTRTFAVGTGRPKATATCSSSCSPRGSTGESSKNKGVSLPLGLGTFSTTTPPAAPPLPRYHPPNASSWSSCIDHDDSQCGHAPVVTPPPPPPLSSPPGLFRSRARPTIHCLW